MSRFAVTILFSNIFKEGSTTTSAFKKIWNKATVDFSFPQRFFATALDHQFRSEKNKVRESPLKFIFLILIIQ